MPRGLFGNFFFACIARKLCGNHLKKAMAIQIPTIIQIINQIIACGKASGRTIGKEIKPRNTDSNV